MRITVTRASILLPLTSLLYASTVFCASPPRPTAATEPSTTVSPAAAGEPSPAVAPVTTAALPAAAPGEPTTAPEAAKSSASGTQTSTASLPVSPSRAPNPAALPSSSPTERPAPEAQHDAPATLFQISKKHSIGGFGGLGAMYTRFAGGGKPQLCLEGGAIFDHALTIGAGGCGIPQESLPDARKYGPAPHYANDRMQFAYGGAIVRYHFFSRNILNLAVGALIGGGGITIGRWNGSGDEGKDAYTNRRKDAVFVFEPQVGGYANLTRWLRVGATAGYRIVSGVNMRGLSASDLSAPTLGGVIQGGWF
jgi:hypothetical protein